MAAGGFSGQPYCTGRQPWDGEDPAALARGFRNLLLLWAAVVLLAWLLL